MDFQHPYKSELWLNDFEIKPFKDLSKPYQMAMAWYMAVDGEAWDDVWDDLPPLKHFSHGSEEYHRYFRQRVEEALPLFIERYGNVEFGVGSWPTSAIIQSIAHDEHIDRPAEETIAIYNSPEPDKYLENYHVKAYPEDYRWPAILSSFEDETLQDGWKRFGFYAGAGYKETPVIFYPTERHYELLVERAAPRPK